MEATLIKIVRYANRKLYCVEMSKTMYLDDIREMIKKGIPVEVTEHNTGMDITAKTLAKAAAYSKERYSVQDLTKALKNL